MKLMGRDVSAKDLLEELEARLRARGLLPVSFGSAPDEEGVEPPVDPLSFNLSMLEEHADPSRPVPVHTHRGGPLGQLVVLTKTLLQKGGGVVLTQALGRQRIFNGHVRDSYAQLSAEVVRLRKELEALKAAARASTRAGAVAEGTAERGKTRPGGAGRKPASKTARPKPKR